MSIAVEEAKELIDDVEDIFEAKLEIVESDFNKRLDAVDVILQKQDRQHDKIEEKIDKILDKLDVIPRIDQKVIQLEEHRAAISPRLDSVIQEVANNSNTTKTISRIFWLIASGMATAFGAAIIVWLMG